MIYQIKTNTKGYRLQHATVTICEDLSGLVTIVSQGKILDYTCHARAKHNPEIIDSKQLGHKIQKALNSTLSWRMNCVNFIFIASRKVRKVK